MTLEQRHAILRAAQVVGKYAKEIRESECHHAGPLKGKCEPHIEAELLEYREIVTKLIDLLDARA